MPRSETRSATEALEWMQGQKNSHDRMLFRGQKRVYPTIRPSIARIKDQKTRNEMWTICRHFYGSAMGVTGYRIEKGYDRLSILQHYILQSPVIDLTGTPKVALYFAVLKAEIGEECVVYSVDRNKAEEPGVVFSDHFFLALPLEDGGLKHRWLRQDGFSVGPEGWSDSSKVGAFDLLKLDGVSRMCFERGSDDKQLVAGLGDLESLDDDPLASKVRGVVTSIAKSLDVLSPGIQEILENSKTRDSHEKLADEIDGTISRAKEVHAPVELVQTLEDLKRASEGNYWDTSFDAGLLWVQERLSSLKDKRVKETATERP